MRILVTCILPPEIGLAHAIVNGVTTGSMIALGAIGLSMVYSIGKVPNFAHGDLLTIGAYLALLVNRPSLVPWFNLLAPQSQTLETEALGILFFLTAAGVLSGISALGGRAALLGSWWPIDPPPLVALAAHLVLAIILGAFVAMTTPSIVAGMVLAGALMAGLTPLLEQFVFAKFRAKDASLVMMLMASLALAFVLRFSIQTYFGGTTKSYIVKSSFDLGAATINVATIKFFDLYVLTEGFVLHVTDPAADTVIAMVKLGWVGFGLALLVGVGAGYLAYRWRLGERAILGPYLLGTLIGMLGFVVVSFAFSSSASLPNSALYTDRIKLSILRAFIIVLALLMMGSLHSVLRATKLGKAMRATSDNRNLAQIRGINTKQVTMGVWIFAGVFAGVGGVTLGFLFGTLKINMGFFLLLPMFAAVILGGLTIYGAILGSYLVGLTMEIGVFAIPFIGGTYRVPLAFVVLFLVLLVKPEGITG